MNDQQRQALAAALLGNYQDLTPQQAFAQNAPYIQPGAGPYQTTLSPIDEMAFRQWVATNHVPFDPNAAAPQDYDMRGFYQALQEGSPNAMTDVNPNDHELHFSDYFKTPYHHSFSRESQFATPAAPEWINDYQLASPSGRVVYDERKMNSPQAALARALLGTSQ